MMRKYRKKPVVIEAVQWDGENTKEILSFCDKCYSYQRSDIIILNVSTLEGSMRISVNDYVIKGVDGEFYPCKDNIFQLTYDEVTE